MERDLGQIRVDSVQHHQFFPGGGAKQLFPSGRVDTPSWAGTSWSGGERAIQRDEWNAGSWRFDGGTLTAQRVSRGGGALGFQLDSRRSGTPEGEHEVIEIDDDEGEVPVPFIGRQTPSPPLSEPNPYNRGGESPPEEDDGPLTSLKLGGSSYAYAEENGAGKRGRSASPPSQVPNCQVDGCTADLSKAKDYHRRHKVCETHAKATTARVSAVMQRFCQQCSRFHSLDSFDEGKRSCRRRLAGHNKRRRKTQPDAPVGRAEEQGGVKSADLVTILGVLSQLKGPLERASAAASEQDLLLQCLRQVGNLPGSGLEGLTGGAPSWGHVTRSPEVGLPQMDPNLVAAHLNGQLQPQAIAMLLQSNMLKQAAMLAGLNGNMQGGPVAYPSSNVAASISHGVPHTYSERTSAVPAMPASLRMPGVMDPAQLLANVALSVQQNMAVQGAGQGNMGVHGYPMGQAPVQGGSVGGHPGVDTRNFMDQRAERIQENGASVASAAGRQRQVSQNGVSQSHKRSFMEVQQSPALLQRPSIDLQQPPSEQDSDTSETGSGSGLGSGSGSGQQSPSTPHSEWENTRITFKLFDKHPGEFPEGLRSQIDEWLSHRPSNMEGFIRPGCIILSLFLSMPKSAWAELIRDLPRSLNRLLSSGSREFWCTGRMLVHVERQSVLIVDGEIVECKESNPWESPYILSVRPLAVVTGEQSSLVVSGFNLTRTVTRLLCAFRGRYYSEEVDEERYISLESTGSVSEIEEAEDTAEGRAQDAVGSSDGETDSVISLGGDLCPVDDEEVRSVSEPSSDDVESGSDDDEVCAGRRGDSDARWRLCCTRAVFNLDSSAFAASGAGGSVGRCIIEVDQDTLEGNWKPVIVADEQVCREIRSLEDEIEMAAFRAGRVAEAHGYEECVVAYCSELARLAEEEDVTRFLHELGWFFQRSYFRSLDCSPLSTVVFSARFRHLLVYSVERSWCAVVQKVLDIAFENDEWEVVFREMSEMCDEEASLLHRAVRNRNRPMVELVLGYAPSFLGGIDDLEMFKRKMEFKVRWGTIFKADMRGPGGLSPLHVAACLEDAEEVVDALTSGACQTGLHAWLHKVDDSGETPLGLAVAAGNIKSVHVVRAKLARLANPGSTIIDVAPGWDQHLKGDSIVQLELPAWRSSSQGNGEVGMVTETPDCRERYFRRLPRDVCGVKGNIYRPFLVSIMGIACICVCVCLLMRGPQDTIPDFSWLRLDQGEQ